MQEVKEFLSWHKHIDVLLNSLNEEITWAKELIQSEHTGRSVNKYVELIRKDYAQKQALKKQIEDVIGAVTDEKLRMFLHIRYIQGKAIEETAEPMGHSLRHVQRLAHKALKAVSELLRISDADKKDIDRRASTSPERDREEYNPNPITETTKKCVCWWFSEGDTVKDIAEILCRPLEVIENILNTCRADGKYDYYIHIKQYKKCQ